MVYKWDLKTDWLMHVSSVKVWKEKFKYYSVGIYLFTMSKEVFFLIESTSA